MKNTLFAVLSVLGMLPSAWAQSGRLVVECSSLPFSDLAKIEIYETDLTGQYVMIETPAGDPKKPSRYSPVFGWEEVKNSEIPALTSWMGYERHLIRKGENDYVISYFDECGGGTISLSCKETF